MILDIPVIGRERAGSRWQEEGPEEGEEVQQVESGPEKEQQEAERPAAGERSQRKDICDNGET